MKKKTLILGAALPLMCLASCKNQLFSYGNIDLNKEYVLYRSLNGKTVSSTSEEASYKTKFNYSTIDEVINLVESGEDILLLFYGEDCHSCQEVIPSLVQDIAYLQLPIYVISENHSESASILNRYIIEKGIERLTTNVVNGGTPSMYLFNQKKLTEVFYGSKGDKTTDTVVSVLKEYTTCCGLYYGFADLGSKGDSAIPTYILDKNNSEATTYYYENVFAKAKKSSKPFQVLDVTRVEKETIKTSILQHFSSDATETEWGLDSFDGWIVSYDTWATNDGKLAIKADRYNYKDEATKTWLENYFKD